MVVGSESDPFVILYSHCLYPDPRDRLLLLLLATVACDRLVVLEEKLAIAGAGDQQPGRRDIYQRKWLVVSSPKRKRDKQRNETTKSREKHTKIILQRINTEHYYLHRQ